MTAKTTVVVSQGQSANPVKRKLEEDLVAALLFERGLEVTVVSHLYDLPPDGTGMLCLQGITGDMVLLSWLYPRAAHWILDRNGIGGRVGQTLLVSDDEAEDDDIEQDASVDDKPRVIDARPESSRTIYCIDLRAANAVEPFITEIQRIAAETSVRTVNVDLTSWIQGSPKPEQLQRYLDPGNGYKKPAASSASANTESDSAGASLHCAPATGGESPTPSHQPPATSHPSPTASAVRIEEAAARRWYPVIDFSRCTNCLECLDFCLFGVYGISAAETILVEQPDNCRKGCPACSRVCPENAIIFPQHKSPAIAGSPNGEAGGLKIDLSKLFGAPDALEVAVRERDVELVAVGKDAVGMAVGIPKRQTGKAAQEKDDLDSLIDSLDELAL